AGRSDGSEDWERRARGWIRVMNIDAWTSMVVFTISTVSFYFMGATVLHAQNLNPQGKDMIATLSRMFVDTFGPWTQTAFLIGAGAVLFKTLYLSSAGNARLVADFLSLNDALRYTQSIQRARVVNYVSLLIPVVALALFVAFKEPRWMVVVGGVGQALTLPIIAGVTIYFRYRRLDRRLAPRFYVDLMLWLAFASITVVALYGVWDKIKPFLQS
ncbi:MAG: Nramp family divalent metal transporter, partial [Planctomycetia bacterium]